MKTQKRRLFGPAIPAVLMIFGLIPFSRPGTVEVTPNNKAAYLAALRDAAVTEQGEISRDLLAIVPNEDPVNAARLKGGSLVWEGEPGRSRILVAAVMSRDSYNRYYRSSLESGGSDYVLTKSLWVTAVPELRNHFRDGGFGPGWPDVPTPLRVKQLLGLHPAYDYDVILEMFVDPADLFRPCPDPEITDHEAELAYPPDGSAEFIAPYGQAAWIFPRDRNPFLVLRNDVFFKDSKWAPALTYKEWFSDRADTIYAVGDESDPTTWGWPWTRLGYTYDWGNPGDHVGLSEFVIRIDPARNGGEALVRLVRAIDSESPDWILYFTRPEYRP